MMIHHQLQSTFFGRLSREVRDLIYDELWVVSGTNQHVFEQEGRITHFPCALGPDYEDTRNTDFDRVWYSDHMNCPKSRLQHGDWARRMDSTWNEHWKCEEAMRAARRDGSELPALFLPCLSVCKKMYNETISSIGSSTTIIITSLPLAHRLFVASPSPHILQLRSLHLSLSVDYASLHHQKLHHPEETHQSWAKLATALSKLVETARLRDVRLRLDLEDDSRFWWEVRETQIFSNFGEELRRRMRVCIPEITADVPKMRPFQLAGVGERDGGRDGEDLCAHGEDHGLGRYQRPAEIMEKPQERGDGGFASLQRYPRRRWTGGGGAQGSVQPRLEFFNVKDHSLLEPSAMEEKMRGLFRGLLLM